VLTLFLLVVIACSGYILVIHLLFKDSRDTTAGRLLIISSTTHLVFYISNTVLSLLHVGLALNSLLICQVVTQAIIQPYMAREAFTTCIITCATQMMYCTHKLISDMPKHLFRYYVYGLHTWNDCGIQHLFNNI